MNEEEPILKSFKSIISEFFYDWGMTHSGDQINEAGDGYWINKTSLGKEKDGTISLSYKTWTYRVEEIAFIDFLFFYENLYKNDKEFENLLSLIADSWFTSDGENQGKITKEDFGYQLNDLKIIKIEKDYYSDKNGVQSAISNKVFQKFEAFFSLIKN